MHQLPLKVGIKIKIKSWCYFGAPISTLLSQSGSHCPPLNASAQKRQVIKPRQTPK